MKMTLGEITKQIEKRIVNNKSINLILMLSAAIFGTVLGQVLWNLIK
jgi:hypothetical protein